MSQKVKLTTNEVFEQACGESSRFFIEAPFVVGDHQYATNGVVCVRRHIPARVGPSPTPLVELRPPVLELPWRREAFSQNGFPMEDLGPVWMEDCSECGGKDRFCEACMDEGPSPVFAGIHLDPPKGFVISSASMRFLYDAGVREVFPNVDQYIGLNNQVSDIAYFLGDGFDGLVMGCYRKESPYSAADYRARREVP